MLSSVAGLKVAPHTLHVRSMSNFNFAMFSYNFLIAIIIILTMGVIGHDYCVRRVKSLIKVLIRLHPIARFSHFDGFVLNSTHLIPIFSHTLSPCFKKAQTESDSQIRKHVRINGKRRVTR